MIPVALDIKFTLKVNSHYVARRGLANGQKSAARKNDASELNPMIDCGTIASLRRGGWPKPISFFLKINALQSLSHYVERTAKHAVVAELVDALDLGSSAARRESSSLSDRTTPVFGFLSLSIRLHEG